MEHYATRFIFETHYWRHNRIFFHNTIQFIVSDFLCSMFEFKNTWITSPAKTESRYATNDPRFCVPVRVKELGTKYYC
jgi:hypothetical protein